MREFKEKDLLKLYKSGTNSTKTDNGQVTIIGGSKLFHGAPIAALKIASKVVDMVFFSSPENSVGEVAAQIKSQLTSFIWIPWEKVEEYVEKSDAILIGPGFLRYHGEDSSVCDEACQMTKKITESLIKKFPEKQWVIDAGSLQTMNVDSIPKGAILTPNRKEFEILFKIKDKKLKIKNTEQKSKILELIKEKAKKYGCIIVYKAPETIVYSPDERVLIKGGNAGLTKGNTGDVLAGLTVALVAKNNPFFAACTASWIVKKAADKLFERVGFAYNSEDLANKIPEVLGKYYR